MKPCPFCNGGPGVVQHDKVNWSVMCHVCGAEGGWGKPSDAIAAWNNRATNPEVTDEQIRTAQELLQCFLAWEPQVRVLGNTRADDSANAIRALLSLATPSPGKAEAERDAINFRSILVAVVDEIQREDGRYIGNAPGHAHEIPGVWDSDNGPLAGKPCAWCLTWSLARAAIYPEAAPTQPDESDRLFILLAEIRAAAGDNGERMQSELVPFIAGLARDAGRYRWMRENYLANDPTIDAAIQQERDKQ